MSDATIETHEGTFGSNTNVTIVEHGHDAHRRELAEEAIERAGGGPHSPHKPDHDPHHPSAKHADEHGSTGHVQTSGILAPTMQHHFHAIVMGSPLPMTNTFGDQHDDDVFKLEPGDACDHDEGGEALDGIGRAMVGVKKSTGKKRSGKHRRTSVGREKSRHEDEEGEDEKSDDEHLSDKHSRSESGLGDHIAMTWAAMMAAIMAVVGTLMNTAITLQQAKTLYKEAEIKVGRDTFYAGQAGAYKKYESDKDKATGEMVAGIVTATAGAIGGAGGLIGSFKQRAKPSAKVTVGQGRTACTPGGRSGVAGGVEVGGAEPAIEPNPRLSAGTRSRGPRNFFNKNSVQKTGQVLGSQSTQNMVTGIGKTASGAFNLNAAVEEKDSALARIDQDLNRTTRDQFSQNASAADASHARTISLIMALIKTGMDLQTAKNQLEMGTERNFV